MHDQLRSKASAFQEGFVCRVLHRAPPHGMDRAAIRARRHRVMLHFGRQRYSRAWMLAVGLHHSKVRSPAYVFGTRPELNVSRVATIRLEIRLFLQKVPLGGL